MLAARHNDDDDDDDTITTMNSRSQSLGQERKIFCFTTYLETELFKTVSKSVQLIDIIMIYY